MNAPAAISGTFVKIEPVATRKVVRLAIECPIEQANEVLAVLGGYPDPANPAHVAVARLVPAAVTQGQSRASPADNGSKRRMQDLPPAQQAALTCQREAFWRFLEEQHNYGCESEDDAADAVRKMCAVESRSELATNHKSRVLWNQLLSQFEAWLQVPA